MSGVCTNINFIQKIVAFTSRDTIELTKLSKVHPTWEETCDDYLFVGNNDFKVFTYKYPWIVEKGYVPSLIKYTALLTNFKDLLIYDEEEMRLSLALVSGGFKYHKYNSMDIFTILKRCLGYDISTIPFLAALMDNMELFQFCVKKEDFVYDFTYNPLYCCQIEDVEGFISKSYNKRGSYHCWCEGFHLMSALIRSGNNIDYIKSNYDYADRSLFASDVDGGDGVVISEYDIAIDIPDPVKSKETIWWLFVGDFLSDWECWSVFKDQTDPEYEAYRSEICCEAYELADRRNRKMNDSDYLISKSICNYLNPKNDLEEIENSFDQWEYDKFKWLIETYPIWKTVKAIMTFRKTSYFSLIEENFHKLDLSDYTEDQIDRKYKMFIKFEQLIKHNYKIVLLSDVSRK